MKMHYSHRLSGGRIAKIVGTFVAVPLVVLVLVGLFMARAEHLFEGKYHLVASLSKSYGLEPGSPVVISGIPIGRVEQVDLNDRGTVDVRLLLRTRYQEMVKDDSTLTVTKSGVVVGQTQVELGIGTAGGAVLRDEDTLRVVEPRDIGDILNDLDPVLQAVKQTLIRVEAITQDLQGSVKSAGSALDQVAQATRQLPTVMASVQRTLTSVEQTTASLPNMTKSIQQTLGVVDRVASDVQRTTDKLPAVVESTQDALKSVKKLSESVNDVSQELIPVVQTAQTTLTDVSTLVRGAKNTFPFSRFVQNAGPRPSAAAQGRVPTLRGDQLGK